MSKVDIARALKDKAYFNSLSAAEQAQVRAANPAGEIEVDDSALDTVSGGQDELLVTGTGTSLDIEGGGAGGGDSTLAGNNCNCNC